MNENEPQPMKLFLFATLFAGAIPAAEPQSEHQPRGKPLVLVESDPLKDMRLPDRTDPPKTAPAVRPAILVLKPAGDPIYISEESPDNWRTYQRPKVDAFSRNGEGIAIQGYDVVSYLENRPELGSANFSADYGGVQWRFASQEHRMEFLKDPSSYVPQYGGFCAYSIGRGYPATADPRAFASVDGKLYLFFDKAVRTVWEQERQRLVAAADRNWPRIHRTPAK